MNTTELSYRMIGAIHEQGKIVRSNLSYVWQTTITGNGTMYSEFIFVEVDVRAAFYNTAVTEGSVQIEERQVNTTINTNI